MTPSESLKRELEAELGRVKNEEAQIEEDLNFYLASISNADSRVNGSSYESIDLKSKVEKVENFIPCFEAIFENAKKLSAQVDECSSLSDRLSVMVRRLDLMQIRAQQALACTEDVINLKECRIGAQQALEEGNIPLAVSFVRQVHDIELQAAKASDDYGAMQQAEREIKIMVQQKFNSAISEAKLDEILYLCPFLQTLGLENEARDHFMSFMETNVFLAVSADMAMSSLNKAADNGNMSNHDPATSYVQALSTVLNTTCSIYQQYLPSIIQGMERSYTDVFFIRKLHSKCEQECGLVLKRYMKFRNIRELISGLKSSSSSANPSSGSFMNAGIASSTAGYSSSKNLPASNMSAAEIHMVLDELALLIQYCCSYSNYLKQLCVGAETRTRGVSNNSSMDSAGKLSSNSNSAVVTVFKGATEFDKMVDELINR